MPRSTVTVRRESLVKWAIATSALAPFAAALLHMTPYGPSLDTPRFAGIVLSAALWAWVWALMPLPAAPKGLGAATGVLALVVVASAAFSAHPEMALTYGEEESLLGAPAWLALLGVFWMASRVADAGRSHRAFLLVFWGAIPSALWAAIEILSQGEARGSFGNANYYGPVMLLLVPIALVEFRRASRPSVRRGWGAATALLVLTTAFSASLAVSIGLAAEAAVAVLVAPRLLGIDKARDVRRARAALLAVSLLVAAWVAASVGTDVLPEGPLSAPRAVAERNTTQSRLLMIQESVSIWRDEPVLGAGPDGFRVASQQHLQEERVRRESGRQRDTFALTRDPHSLPFLLLASFGAAGVLAAAAVLFAWGRGLRERLGSAGGLVSAAYGIGTAGFLVSLLAIPWPARFAALPALAAGLAVARPEGRTSDSHAATATRLPGVRLAVAGLVSLCALALALPALYGDYTMYRVRNADSFRDAVSWAERGLAVQPLRPGLEYERLLVLGQGVWDGPVARDDFQRAVEEASPRMRGNAGYLAGVAQVALDSARVRDLSDVAWESNLIQTAGSLSPSHPEVVLAEAYQAIVEGDLGRARTLLDRAADLKITLPRRALYEHYLANMQGDPTGSARYAEIVRRESPWLAGLLLAP